MLFAQILAVSQTPDSAEKLADLKDSMRKHFDYEQQRFCSVPSYNCVDHKMKHYRFWVILEDLQMGYLASGLCRIGELKPVCPAIC